MSDNVTPINAAAAIWLNAEAGGSSEPLHVVTDAPQPALERLLLLQVTAGITEQDYAEASRELGVGRRQIQRLLKVLRERRADQPGAVRHRFALSEQHRAVIMACNGNVKLAYTQLVDTGEDLPSYETFWRRWFEEPKGLQRYARKGAEGLIEFWLYPPYEAPERNLVWQADHFELPNEVIADGCTTQLVKPWLTLFEDDHSRVAMSFALTAVPGSRPDQEVVIATIASGIRVRVEDGIEVGGIPKIMRWDNDKNFLAGSVTRFGNSLGFECHAVPPNSGPQKGKIERLGRTVQEQFCVLQPAYTHGPNTYSRRAPERDTPPLTAAEYRRRLAAWLAEYNRTTHSSTGMTPLEKWAASTTPLRRASDEQLRPALLVAPRKHTINKRKGIHFAGQFWMGAGIMDRVGCKAEIRYPVGDDIDFIEVYVDGRWIGTAWPARELTDDQKSRIWDARRDMYRDARQLQDQAVRMRVEANAKSTDATPAVAKVPIEDPLAASAEDLYDLLNAATGTDDTTTTRNADPFGPADPGEDS